MRLTVTILFFAIIGFASSQQTNLNTQYLFNDMLVNPAAAGSKEYIPIQFNFRKQWVNFPGSPTTEVLSAHGKVARNFGLGGVFYNDVAGPSRRTGGNINFAYHIRLDQANSHFLSLGLGADISQHFIDKNRLNTYLPDDPAVVAGFNNKLVPDANFGVFYYFKEKGFAGISAYNLIQSRTDLFNVDFMLYNPIVRSYLVYGGYDITMAPKHDLKLYALGRVIETGTFQFDISAVYEWNKRFWVGFSYRHLDAVSAMAGAQFGPFRFGYSYDYTISEIGKYSYGSHEVFLEVRLFTKKSGASESNPSVPWLKRNRIYSDN